MLKNKVLKYSNDLEVLKGFSLVCFKNLVFIVAAIFFCTQISAVAIKSSSTKISSIYFNSASSFILELNNRSSLKILSIKEFQPSIYEIVIDNSKFNRDLETDLSNSDFDLNFIRNDKSQIVITVKSKKGSKYEIQSKTVLEGLAYQFDLITKATELVPPKQNDSWRLISSTTESIEQPQKHQLNALIEDHKIYTISSAKSEAEEFLQTIDPTLANQITASAEFKHENFNRIDSSSLSYIAEKLIAKGLETDAARAYRRAITLDPRNLNARLGLAQTSTNSDEKITNYLLSLDDKALIEVGDIWFKEALESKDDKLAAKALSPYQFLVLKNPSNAEYRFRYAQILARSGSHLQAAKRYLEAAALAKTQYLSGNKSVEGLLRGATEALITSLTNQGDYTGAAKYCGSYQNLGFNKFLNGRAIAGILKEVEANRNPFEGREG